MQHITSPDNEFIKGAKKLHQKKYREREGRFLAEGSRLVREAIKAGAAECLLVHEGWAADDDWPDVVPAIRVSERVLKTLSETETPQGVIAVCRGRKPQIPQRLDPGVWLAVDSLADPGNLGTIIRTVWGVGARGLILIGDCVDPYNSKVVRSSMGGIFFVPLLEATVADLARWKGQGHNLVIADATAPLLYSQVDYPNNSVLIIGSEARGVAPAIADLADLQVKLPLAVGVDSINAAVCAGVLLYEIKRRQQASEH